jgi:hypothetical protein
MDFLLNKIFYQVAEKRPSAAFRLILRPCGVQKVRLTPKDFGSLATGHF